MCEIISFSGHRLIPLSLLLAEMTIRTHPKAQDTQRKVITLVDEKSSKINGIVIRSVSYRCVHLNEVFTLVIFKMWSLHKQV